MTECNAEKKVSSRTQVLEAVHSLHEQGLEITTASLVRATGLRTMVVSDCIKELRERDEIYSVERGVYRPAYRHEEARAVSTTAMGNGRLKIEVGDDVLDLTPREAWLLALNLSGYATSMASAQYVHQMSQLAERVAKAERRSAALEARLLGGENGQMALEV